MKITEFSPMVVSPNADEIIKLFEDLGFEKEHAKEGIEDRITSVTMQVMETLHYANLYQAIL